MKNVKRLSALMLTLIMLFTSVGSYAVFARDVNKPGDLGDADGNGRISLMDIQITLKAIAGWENNDEYLAEAADVNRDGKVNLTDVAMNMKLLAGWYDINDGGLTVEFIWE